MEKIKVILGEHQSYALTFITTFALHVTEPHNSIIPLLATIYRNHWHDY